MTQQKGLSFLSQNLKLQVDLTTAALGVRDESGCLVLGSLAGHVRRQSVVGLAPSQNYWPTAAQAVSEKSAAERMIALQTAVFNWILSCDYYWTMENNDGMSVPFQNLNAGDDFIRRLQSFVVLHCCCLQTKFLCFLKKKEKKRKETESNNVELL